MATVYIETSIALLAKTRGSNESSTYRTRLLTRKWWDALNAADFDFAISQYVLDEAADGDPTLAADVRSRLKLLREGP